VWYHVLYPAIQEEGGMSQQEKKMDVEVKPMPALRVAAVRHAGPYRQIGKAFERLGAIASAAGLFQQPGAVMIAIYHDDPDTTPQDKLRSDAGIVVPDHVQLPDGLVEQRIPAGRYARTEHVGPYEQLEDAWSRFKDEALPAGGHRIGARPSYEIYRNDPTKVPKEELRTEMYISVA
jgi:AraC family transcriptional regulator